MSEVIRCPHCGSRDQLGRQHVSEQAVSQGLALFECNNCKKNFWYNTGNSVTVINN